MTVEHDALVELALELSGEAAAVLLDVFMRTGRVSQVILERCVAPAWDWCGAPMTVLTRERWIALFEAAGYTHEHQPGEPPVDPVRLYRGSDRPGEFGMCWSLNIDVARWLAASYADGWVWTAEVEPWRLLAFMAAGYEDQYGVDTTGLETTVLESPEVVAAIDRDELARRLDAVADGLGVGGPCRLGPESEGDGDGVRSAEAVVP